MSSVFEEQIMTVGNENIDVLFIFPSSLNATSVAVVGDFNGWACDADVMARALDGSFRLSLRLSVGRTYQYRYLIDGCRWVNDWQADSYVPNCFGGDDSLLDLTAGGLLISERVPEPSLSNSPAEHYDPADVESTDTATASDGWSQTTRKVYENACS